MKDRPFTFEHLLYFCVFFLALGARLANLNAIPLNDFEAQWALQAYRIVHGGGTSFGPQPGYALLTGVLFFLLGSSDFLARFWPVLAGSSLIWLPYIFRDRLGRKTALLIALGLALDPGLVAIARIAGGPMLAVAFGTLAGAAWWKGKPVAAGILGGLALLSGPAILAGALGVGVAWGLARVAGIRMRGPSQLIAPSVEGVSGLDPAVRLGLLSTGGTLLLAGTLFLRFPQGLGALAEAIPVFLSGWAQSSGVPPSRLVIALIVTQPLPLLFGTLAAGRAWLRRESWGQVLSLWFISALALALAYPAHQVDSLVWALIPLWALAGIGLWYFIERKISRPDLLWALTGLTVVMLASVWLNLAGLRFSQPGDQLYTFRWVIIGGSLLLALLSSLLVAFGWSPEAAVRGSVQGLAISLGLFMVASLGVRVPRTVSNQNLWLPGRGAGQPALLRDTIGELGNWDSGRPDGLEVSLRVKSPALEWALRDLPKTGALDAEGSDELPAVIVSREDEQGMTFNMAYRGQDFVWRVDPFWETMTTADWLNWLVVREIPVTKESVVLWARGNLFPAGTSLLQEGGTPPDGNSTVETDPNRTGYKKDVPLK